MGALHKALRCPLTVLVARPLRLLEFIAIANQSDRRKLCKSEWSLFTVFLPTEKALHRAFVETDGAFGTIAGLQLIEPEGEDLFGRRRREHSITKFFHLFLFFRLVFFRR